MASSPRRAASRALSRSESIDAAALDGDSPNASGRRRSRPEVSRKVIHQSFAYGAPSDGTTSKQSNSGRKSGSAGSPDTSAEGLVKDGEDAAAEEEAAQQKQAPAASRYAALKARQKSGAAAKKGAVSGLIGSAAASPRRSARLSVASGSQDADNATRTRAMADFEEDQADSDEEADANGKARKSSVPPPPASRADNGNTSRQSGYQLSSYFVRAPPAGSMSPGAAEDRRTMLPSSHLRGIQRPSHDPLSPRRDMESMRSSDAGDSRSFASEEAFVRRDVDRDMTPPARGRAGGGGGGWLANLSPWNRRTNGAGSSRAGAVSAADPDFVPDDNETEENRLQRRKGRKSKDDGVYRPTEEDEDDDDDVSDDGRKGRRRKSGEVDKHARGGRDDNRIWMSQKRRKGRKGRRSDGTEVGGNDEDNSQEVIYDDEDDAATSPPSILQRAAATSGPRAAGAWSQSSVLKAAGIVVLSLAVLGSMSPNSSSSPSTATSRQSGAASIPLIGGLFGRRTFTPSNIAPSDFDSFVSRLLSLETTVGSLSATSESLLKSHKEMSRQVSTLELSSKEVRTLLRKMDEDGKMAQAKLDDRTKALEDVGKRLREQVDKLEAHVSSSSSPDSAGSDALRRENEEHRKKVEARLDKLRTDLKRNEDQVAKMAASVKSAESVANQAKQALQPLLEANLPAQMPVKIDKRSGKPQIEPWFYEALKGVVGSSGSGSSGSDEGSMLSWDAFKRAHGSALRALIHAESDDLFEERRKSHALVSRSDFLALFQAEIETMKSSLEETFNEHAQSMQNDILAKVRTQQTMFEESGSWSKAGSKKAAGGSLSAGEAVPLTVPDLGQLRAKDGSDPRNSILALIDAALDTYSMSKTNKADFALYSAGGRVIPSLTSPTFEMSSRAGASTGRGWWPVSSKKPAATQFRSRSPVVALHHDNAPGMCWPFAGQTGQLGIQLARPAIVTDFTIEHPPASLTFGDFSAAPRDITVWGLVQRHEDREKLARWREAEAARAASVDGEGEEVDMKPAPPSPHHLHLATFTYEATAHNATSSQHPGRRPRSVQTFPVSPEAAALSIPVSVVQVRFLSNHGNKDYTCSYRVQVHGVAFQQEEA